MFVNGEMLTSIEMKGGAGHERRETKRLPQCDVHELRHTVATWLFEKGVALRDISKQLGHGQTSTTERIYVTRNNVVNNAEALESIINF